MTAIARAAELRAAFDRAFAEPTRGVRPAYVDLLRIRLGGEPHVVALAALAGLHVDLRVVALPTLAPELLGVVAVRGAIVPVYDLRRLVGAEPTGVPRWIAQLPDGAAAFAFDGFDGHLRVGALPPAGGIVSHGGWRYPIVDLEAVLAVVRERWAKEH